jgi:hypothetical protein
MNAKITAQRSDKPGHRSAGSNRRRIQGGAIYGQVGSVAAWRLFVTSTAKTPSKGHQIRIK